MCATNALLLTLLTQKPLAPILTKIGIPIQSTGIYRGSYLTRASLGSGHNLYATNVSKRSLGKEG